MRAIYPRSVVRAIRCRSNEKTPMFQFPKFRSLIRLVLPQAPGKVLSESLGLTGLLVPQMFE